MQVLDDDAILQRAAGPLVCRDAVQVTAADTAPEHQDASGVGEMPGACRSASAP
jgi:hypothetical protein